MYASTKRKRAPTQQSRSLESKQVGLMPKISSFTGTAHGARGEILLSYHCIDNAIKLEEK